MPWLFILVSLCSSALCPRSCNWCAAGVIHHLGRLCPTWGPRPSSTAAATPSAMVLPAPGVTTSSRRTQARHADRALQEITCELTLGGVALNCRGAKAGTDLATESAALHPILASCGEPPSSPARRASPIHGRTLRRQRRLAKVRGADLFLLPSGSSATVQASRHDSIRAGPGPCRGTRLVTRIGEPGQLYTGTAPRLRAAPTRRCPRRLLSVRSPRRRSRSRRSRAFLARRRQPRCPGSRNIGPAP